MSYFIYVIEVQHSAKGDGDASDGDPEEEGDGEDVGDAASAADG